MQEVWAQEISTRPPQNLQASQERTSTLRRFRNPMQQMPQEGTQQEQTELNEGHWIEALERASLMSDIFETMRSHPVFIQTSGLQERLQEIDNKLGEFYQAVGVESEKSRTKEIDKDNDYWEGYMDGN